MDKRKMAEKLIRAWRFLNVADHTGIFGCENVFTKSMDEISDALLILAGEENGEYQNSATYSMLRATTIPPDAAANTLIVEEPVQPRPVFFTQEQIDRMQAVMGGYVHEGK